MLPRRDRLSDRGAHGRRVSSSLATQLIQSAASFLVALLLLPVLGPSGFGVFTIGLSIQLLATGLVDAGMLTPLAIRAGRLAPDVAARYVGGMSAPILLSCLGAALLTTAFAFVAATPLRIPPAETQIFSIAVFSGCLAGSVREVLRTLLVAGAHAASMLRVELAATAVLLLPVGAVSLGHVRISGSEALLLTSLPLAIHATALGYGVRKRFRIRRIRLTVRLARRGLRFLAASQVTWFQSQSYMYFLSALASPAALGTISAARMFFAPLLAGFTGLARGALPGFARIAATRPGALAGSVLRMDLGLLAVAALWTGAALALHEPARTLRAFDAYPVSSDHILAWGCVVVAGFLRASGSIALKALDRPDLLLRQGAVGAVVAVCGIPLLMPVLGPVGALVGLALAESAAFAYGRTFIRRHSSPATLRPTPP